MNGRRSFRSSTTWIGALLAGVVLALPAARCAHAEGAISGRVLLPAAPPAPRMPERYRSLSPNVAMEPQDVPAASVYLEAAASGGADASDSEGTPQPPASPGQPAAAAGPAKTSVAQRGLQFRPGLSAVRSGEAVEFPNLDDTYHSVFSYSKSKRFDLGRYRKGEEPASIVFDKPGVVKLFCEIHDHMRGTILVLDTPYFTKTDTDGSFRIENVPAGRYRLTAWMDEGHAPARDVDVADGETVNVEIDVR